MQQTNLEQYLDYNVVDQSGDKIGKVACLWCDSNGEAAYLGVQTGWFLGKTHVVPAQKADFNARSRTIRLPYLAQHIKAAPCYDTSTELDANTETQVRSYYGLATASPRTAAPRQDVRGQEAASVKLHEEQVKIGKRQVEAGGIRLRKVIRTETVSQPVELQREEIVVERVPASGEYKPGTEEFQKEDVFIPLRREEPVVQKEARLREEVKVSKQTQTERQTVSEQVRKEDVEVEQASMGTVPMPPGVRGGQERQAARSQHHGHKAAFCLCHDDKQASFLVDQLKNSGFSSDDISVILPDRSGTRDFAHEKHTKAPEGATTGAVGGGVLGGVLGWLVGAGTLAIPGLGPLIAAGPIVAALSSAAVGASAGGVIGALVGMGIPEYEARRYEGKIREGHILLSVHLDSSEETARAKDIFRRSGATDISDAGEEGARKAA